MKWAWQILKILKYFNRQYLYGTSSNNKNENIFVHRHHICPTSRLYSRVWTTDHPNTRRYPFYERESWWLWLPPYCKSPDRSSHRHQQLSHLARSAPLICVLLHASPTDHRESERNGTHSIASHPPLVAHRTVEIFSMLVNKFLTTPSCCFDFTVLLWRSIAPAAACCSP